MNITKVSLWVFMVIIAISTFTVIAISGTTEKITVDENTYVVALNGINYTIEYQPIVKVKCIKAEKANYINPACVQTPKDVTLDTKVVKDVAVDAPIVVDKNMLIKTKDKTYEIVYTPKTVTACICELHSCRIADCAG